MTRRDYIFLAEAFANALRTAATLQEKRGVAHAARGMACALHTANPNFSVELFLTNCGLVRTETHT